MSNEIEAIVMPEILRVMMKQYENAMGAIAEQAPCDPEYPENWQVPEKAMAQRTAQPPFAVYELAEQCLKYGSGILQVGGLALPPCQPHVRGVRSSWIGEETDCEVPSSRDLTVEYCLCPKGQGKAAQLVQEREANKALLRMTRLQADLDRLRKEAAHRERVQLRERINEWAKQGHSAEHIAEELEMTPAELHYQCSQIGVNINSLRWEKEMPLTKKERKLMRRRHQKLERKRKRLAARG